MYKMFSEYYGEMTTTKEKRTEKKYRSPKVEEMLEDGGDKARRTRQKQKERRDKRDNMWEGWDG